MNTTPGQQPDLSPEAIADRKSNKNRRINKRVLKIGGGVIAGFIIFGIGAAAGGEDLTADRTVEVEVIKEVKVPVPGEKVTKEVEVEVPGEDVEVVPDVCIDALDDAEGVVHFVADMWDDMNFSDAANTQLGELVDVYNGSSLGCRLLHETNK